MTDSTKGAALFGKPKQEQPVTKNVTPPPRDVTSGAPPDDFREGKLRISNLPPGLPPELVADLPNILAGGEPSPEAAQTLGAMLSQLGPMLGGMGMAPQDPLQQKQQERRELAKALLLSMAQGGLTLDAEVAVRETTALLQGLDEMDVAERRAPK